MQIQEMNRKSMKLVSDKIMAALAPLGKELGISFRDKGGKYDADYGTFKIEGAIIRNGKTKSSEVVAFELYASSFGLKKSDLGKTFDSPYSNESFKIVGLNPKRYKRPIIGEKIGTGKRFVFEAEMVAKQLGYPVAKKNSFSFGV